jgi:hypothetical protein
MFPENNVAKCGNIITAAADRESAVRAAESAVRAVRIRLEAPDAETDAFLGLDFPALPSGVPGVPRAGGGFPPDAFSLTPALAALLAGLPEPALPPVPAAPALIPFPALTESDLRDYQGRTVQESLAAVRELTGFPLIPDANPSSSFLGRGFWAAFIRGGYQGAVYYVDRLFPAEFQKDTQG